MKQVSFVAGKSFHGNLIFDKNQKEVLVGSFDKYHRLYDYFKIKGYELATDDVNKPEDSDIVLYFDMPNVLPRKNTIQKSYLLAIESSIIRTENFDTNMHQNFNKIFTWNDVFIDNKKYIKLNYSFSLPSKIYKKINREYLCCLIVSHKNSNYKNELYSERKQLVRWFEKNHPEDFHLYGFGWDEFKFVDNKLVRALNKILFLKRLMYHLFTEKFSNYRGTIESKSETMKDYKFAIAYENVKDELGYITEKIFDVFIAGCVPIYWGAKNITSYVPENCFIDRRKFNTNEALYDYLNSMPDHQYREYLDKIEEYLRSEQAQQFSSEIFAKTIVDHCINDANR
jgi:hypothetical protein